MDEEQLRHDKIKLKCYIEIYKNSKKNLVDTFFQLADKIDYVLNNMSDMEGDEILNTQEQLNELYQLLIKAAKKIISK